MADAIITATTSGENSGDGETTTVPVILADIVAEEKHIPPNDKIDIDCSLNPVNTMLDELPIATPEKEHQDETLIADTQAKSSDPMELASSNDVNKNDCNESSETSHDKSLLDDNIGLSATIAQRDMVDNSVTEKLEQKVSKDEVMNTSDSSVKDMLDLDISNEQAHNTLDGSAKEKMDSELSKDQVIFTLVGSVKENMEQNISKDQVISTSNGSVNEELDLEIGKDQVMNNSEGDIIETVNYDTSVHHSTEDISESTKETQKTHEIEVIPAVVIDGSEHISSERSSKNFLPIKNDSIISTKQDAVPGLSSEIQTECPQTLSSINALNEPSSMESTESPGAISDIPTGKLMFVTESSEADNISNKVVETTTEIETTSSESHKQISDTANEECLSDINAEVIPSVTIKLELQDSIENQNFDDVNVMNTHDSTFIKTEIPEDVEMMECELSNRGFRKQMNGRIERVEGNVIETADVERTVTMLDVLQEQHELEEDAAAVLGASDDKNCTYNEGYIKRQALYACLTCCSEARNNPTKRAGVCLACSLSCHENHELIELYTKRNFRCDCGNQNFDDHPCSFTKDKNDLNSENKYNQNFSGLYCVCHRPYPDPESTVDDEMIQCIVCEDWLHASHLESTVPDNDQYSEMICKACMDKNDFLHDYTCYAISIEDNTINRSHSDTHLNEQTDTEISQGETNREISVQSDKHERSSKINDVDMECDVASNGQTCTLTISDITSLDAPQDVNLDIGEDSSKKIGGINIEEIMDAEDFQKKNKDHTSEGSSKNENNTEGETQSIHIKTLKEIESDTHHTTTSINAETSTPSNYEKTIVHTEGQVDDEESQKQKEKHDSEANLMSLRPTTETNAMKDTDKTDATDSQITDLIRNTETFQANLPENCEVTLIYSEQTEIGSSSEATANSVVPPEVEIRAPADISEKNIESTNKVKTLELVIDPKEDIEILGAVFKESDKIDSESSIKSDSSKEHTDKIVTEPSTDDISIECTDQTCHKPKTENDVQTLKNPSQEPTEFENNITDETEKETLKDFEKTSCIENTDIQSSPKVCENSSVSFIEENNEEVSEIQTESSEPIEQNSNINRNDPNVRVDNNETTDQNCVLDIVEMDLGKDTNTQADGKETSNDMNDSSGGNSNKRKISTDGDGLENISNKKHKLSSANDVADCKRPKSPGKRYKGTTFWPCNWRQKLCSCFNCVTMYKDKDVLFLLDLEDTVSAYEDLGKSKNQGRTSQYEKGLEALSSLDRTQQINALTEYNRMKNELLNYLISFKNRQEVVKVEDIEKFFSDIKPKKKSDGVYFCR